jgi:ubiquinone/menaquinone biosynthesis C-methylase UbiE
MTDDMWGTGDYRAVAEKVTSIRDVLVSRAAIEPGMEVLDVACGTGNATIPAAKLGARATGLDFSPGLVAIARERGTEAGVDVEWLEGDAQSLPFEDEVEVNEADDGTLRYRGEYLVSVTRRA